jgi:hypothetical protein
MATVALAKGMTCFHAGRVLKNVPPDTGGPVTAPVMTRPVTFISAAIRRRRD